MNCFSNRIIKCCRQLTSKSGRCIRSKRNFSKFRHHPAATGLQSNRFFSNDAAAAATGTNDYDLLSSDISNAFNEQLPKTNENISKTNDKFDDIMSRIREIDGNDSTIPQALVYEVCYFMTQYHTTRALNLGSINPESSDAATNILKFKSSQKEDLLKAWSLLENSMKNKYVADISNANVNDGLNRSNIDILKVEIATRLEDSSKLKIAFIELLSKNSYDSDVSRKIESLVFGGDDSASVKEKEDELTSILNSLNNDELMIAFTTVPYLGYWSIMDGLGMIILNKLENAFDSLYAMSQELPIPDFPLIYELVSENGLFDSGGGGGSSHDAWKLIDINDIQIRFSNVLCYDIVSDMNSGGEDNVLQLNELKQKGILDNITEEQRQWTKVDINEDSQMISLQGDGGINNSCLRQMGALMSGRSFYSYGDMIPVSLYGPMMKNKIHVKGRIEIPIFNEEGNNNNNDDKNSDSKTSDTPEVVVLHEEEWKLNKSDENDDSNNKYIGRYIIRQRPMIPKGANNNNDDNDASESNKERINANLEKFAPMDWIYDLEIELK